MMAIFFGFVAVIVLGGILSAGASYDSGNPKNRKPIPKQTGQRRRPVVKEEEVVTIKLMAAVVVILLVVVTGILQSLILQLLVEQQVVGEVTTTRHLVVGMGIHLQA